MKIILFLLSLVVYLWVASIPIIGIAWISNKETHSIIRYIAYLYVLVSTMYIGVDYVGRFYDWFKSKLK